jgi:hypothetical protein
VALAAEDFSPRSSKGLEAAEDFRPRSSKGLEAAEDFRPHSSPVDLLTSIRQRRTDRLLGA